MNYYEQPIEVQQYAIEHSRQIQRSETEFFWDEKRKVHIFFMKDGNSKMFQWDFDGIWPFNITTP